ncbi:MAG: flagellar export protein FliJ [Bdellovibrionales bacterium GWA2_49_15]|nr:MAG: flagellar export protein FliJ [Bdellovibrionales bacterium GWA2_49_15]HAZ11888.1 flagellar export protein FliJ [Bdellovibrionales bacterium]
MAYKFKLQALLKVREFKENNLKIELGRIVQDRESTNARIEQINKDIDEGYRAQNELMNNDITGNELQFFPYYLRGKKDDMERTVRKLAEVETALQKKLQELAVARGESKLLENMRANDFEKFKKDLEKKQHAQVEELFIMRAGRVEKGEES